MGAIVFIVLQIFFMSCKILWKMENAIWIFSSFSWITFSHMNYDITCVYAIRLKISLVCQENKSVQNFIRQVTTLEPN